MSDYTQGLRDLADWLDAHPNWATPQPVGVTFYHVGELQETPEGLRVILREMCDGGGIVHKQGTETLALVRHFGPVALRYVALRHKVCQKRVVGTRRIEAVFSPAYEQEIVEWDCQSILEEAAHE